MELLSKSASTYLLIITRRSASEILLLPSGWLLPRVDADSEQRLGDQLTAEAASTWKVETYCLFFPSIPQNSANAHAKCAVMDSVQNDENPPPGTRWIPRAVAIECCNSLDRAALRESLRQMDVYATVHTTGHFACSGWLQELFRWAQEQLDSCGLRLTGRFRQLNASETFSLIRLEINCGAVWFKATGEPNAHELPITIALARLFPRWLPKIFGVHAEWNGWLSEEANGASLDGAADFAAWERAAEDLAEMQISSIGKTDELLAAGCRDLRIPALAEQIDAFIACMGELMAAQKKPAPAPLDRSELQSLACSLREACAMLQAFQLPDTIGHMDFNPGNIFVGEDRSIFLDWSEASVSNPVLTLQYLREYLSRSGMEEPAGSEKLAGVYSRRWTARYSPSEIRQALTLAPLVAVFAYAVSTDSWRSIDRATDDRLAGYYRGLARRMYRDAIEAAQRSELCLR